MTWTVTKEIRIGNRSINPSESPFMIYGYATFTNDETNEVINDATWGDDLSEAEFNDYVSKRLRVLVNRDAAILSHKTTTGVVDVQPKTDDDVTLSVKLSNLQQKLAVKAVLVNAADAGLIPKDDPDLLAATVSEVSALSIKS